MTASGPSLRVVVNQPVSLTAVPQIVTQSTAAGNPTQTPTAAAFLPNTVEQFDLSYPDTIDAAFEAVVPFQDGGVRSLYGAHIPAGSHTIV